MALRGGRGDYRGVGGEPYLLQDRLSYLLGGVFLFFASFFSLLGSKLKANCKQTESKKKANRKQNESKKQANRKHCAWLLTAAWGSDGKRKTSPPDGYFVQDAHLWAAIHGAHPRGFGDSAEIGSTHGARRRTGDKRRRGACRADEWSKAQADHKQDGSKLQAKRKQKESNEQANSKQNASNKQANGKQKESTQQSRWVLFVICALPR